MKFHPFFFAGQRRPLVRDLEADTFLESFLIAAVTSILGIRAFLQLTGYPQIGGNGVHVAHVLWGGLLMLIALSILLGYSNRPVKYVAAIVGGLGFGAFIDELGKFITSDNNYFFEPSVAFMYVLFILLYLTNRVLHRDRVVTREEAMTNALELMKEAVDRDFDSIEQQRAIDLLAPFVQSDRAAARLSAYIRSLETVPVPSLSLWRRTRNRLTGLYQSFVRQRWFPIAFVGFFAAQSIVTVTVVASRLLALRLDDPLTDLTFSDWGEIVGSSISALLILVGVLQLFRSRRETYEYCIRSMLVSIFVTRVFLFSSEQVSAVVGLGFDILILGALRTLLRLEGQAFELKNAEREKGRLNVESSPL
jgi:Ca2+/Na+ antiporter